MFLGIFTANADSVGASITSSAIFSTSGSSTVPTSSIKSTFSDIITGSTSSDDERDSTPVCSSIGSESEN